jgi:hypothetical protein
MVCDDEDTFFLKKWIKLKIGCIASQSLITYVSRKYQAGYK